MSEVTRLLSRIDSDPSASDKLLPLVYAELRRLATTNLSQEQAGQTLQATALVHEAYLRLVDVAEQPSWDSRGHFFAAAAQAMRRTLVEQARRKRRIKHGGEFGRQDLPEVEAPQPDVDLLNLDETLTRLRDEEELACQVVELRYFAGLTHEQIARSLKTTVYQARQEWTSARAWLRSEMRD